VKITLEMIEAARRGITASGRSAQRGSFRPDPVIRAMLEAAFKEIPDEVAATVKSAAIVRVWKPRRRR
jgi:hypothetical protein